MEVGIDRSIFHCEETGTKQLDLRLLTNTIEYRSGIVNIKNGTINQQKAFDNTKSISIVESLSLTAYTINQTNFDDDTDELKSSVVSEKSVISFKKSQHVFVSNKILKWMIKIWTETQKEIMICNAEFWDSSFKRFFIGRLKLMIFHSVPTLDKDCVQWMKVYIRKRYKFSKFDIELINWENLICKLRRSQNKCSLKIAILVTKFYFRNPELN